MVMGGPADHTSPLFRLSFCHDTLYNCQAALALAKGDTFYLQEAFSSVVWIPEPWRPDPNAAPPPPSHGEAIQVWCPLGPLVYTGCSAAASAASTGGNQGREAHRAPWGPSTCPEYAPGHGEPDPAHVVAPPVPKAVKECGSDPNRATYHYLPVPAGSRGALG